MQGQLEADLEDPEGGVRPEYVVHDHDAGAVHHADAHGGTCPRREVVGIGDRARAQLVQVEVRVPQLQQAGTELIFVRVPVLLNKAMRLERLEQTVHSRPSQAEAVRQLADAEAPRAACECFQDRCGAVDGLNRAASSIFARIRHC